MTQPRCCALAGVVLPMHALNTDIVEDSPVIRGNLIATLEELVPVRVVGCAESGSAAKRLDGAGAAPA